MTNFKMVAIALATLVVSACSPADARRSKLSPGIHKCTPTKLANFARKHRLKIISSYRPGAFIAGTRRRSLHSFCDGRRGALDVKTRQPAKVIREARSLGIGVGTYSRCTGFSHIHLSVGGTETRFYKGCKKRKRFKRRLRSKRR
jgi:uncharacterized protein YcbK (DUF882 family)